MTTHQHRSKAEPPKMKRAGGPAVAFILAWLMPVAAGAAEVPNALIGVWIKQAGLSATNPARVTLTRSEADIGGKRCTLDQMRPLHATRGYADFTCGRDERVWLDFNLLADSRMMVNRRPLAEADIYVRRRSATVSGDGAK